MKEAHIYIYGEIDAFQDEGAEAWGFVNLKSVRNQYEEQKDAEKIIVHIHSVGGVVFEGFAIHDYLRSLGKPIETRVEGLCASIATVIALAGDVRIMTANSDYFIHNPWGFAGGDREQMQKYVDDLERLENKIAEFYALKTNISKEDALALMKSETTFSAEEALNKGFITETATVLKAVAKLNFNNSNLETMKNKKQDGKKEAGTIIDAIMNLCKGATKKDEPKNKIVQDANAVEIDFPDVAEDAKPAVGDRAEVDGAPIEDGEHVMPAYENEIFVFAEGALIEIKPAEDSEEEEDDEDEMAAKDAEIERLKQELADAQAQAKKAAKAQKDAEAKAKKDEAANAKRFAEIEKNMTALREQVGSDYEPEASDKDKPANASKTGKESGSRSLFKDK